MLQCNFPPSSKNAKRHLVRVTSALFHGNECKCSLFEISMQLYFLRGLVLRYYPDTVIWCVFINETAAFCNFDFRFQYSSRILSKGRILWCRLYRWNVIGSSIRNRDPKFPSILLLIGLFRINFCIIIYNKKQTLFVTFPSPKSLKLSKMHLNHKGTAKLFISEPIGSISKASETVHIQKIYNMLLQKSSFDRQNLNRDSVSWV